MCLTVAATCGGALSKKVLTPPAGTDSCRGSATKEMTWTDRGELELASVERRAAERPERGLFAAGRGRRQSNAIGGRYYRGAVGQYTGLTADLRFLVHSALADPGREHHTGGP